ncbi:UNVERIFIED_ORG: hypothetical protein M2438_002691 [Methylobacterium sp. SuP10 SLI 274]|uniref:hypothetical protein n=1 Tax=Methylorubrum extorquens TaxID=408 RepID=UPI0020A1C346|nr:hypothetical protein [Methylorubrum extorquens]MDF9863923.1 hypothetical protein [Methylorubrum pseudosasae]MDH6637516.1 hypothetical protein [Methylobacterium sp. SuP10 SLI 274]MDH6666696.1 hypothetical protein [Methylorubrum zatmanii]MCP1558604.1 hypothetical protein [Methylorubrum extorquens]MDF9792233.1 hypothetical protein [Methylorubrum extorquens]
MLTKRERDVLQWMRDRTPIDGEASFYTDQIGTSGRLLSGLERKGLVRRHDPNTNFFAKTGSGAISWRLSPRGKATAPETGQAAPSGQAEG